MDIKYIVWEVCDELADLHRYEGSDYDVGFIRVGPLSNLVCFLVLNILFFISISLNDGVHFRYFQFSGYLYNAHDKILLRLPREYRPMGSEAIPPFLSKFLF